MIRKLIPILLLLGTTIAIGQQADGTDPIFWCNVSRSQVSAERDAGLAQIERMKLASAQVAHERDDARAQIEKLKADNAELLAKLNASDIKVDGSPVTHPTTEPESK
jgi:hypothetical protein